MIGSSDIGRYDFESLLALLDSLRGIMSASSMPLDNTGVVSSCCISSTFGLLLFSGSFLIEYSECHLRQELYHPLIFLISCLILFGEVKASNGVG